MSKPFDLDELTDAVMSAVAVYVSHELAHSAVP
jgi:hypothetical protein